MPDHVVRSYIIKTNPAIRKAAKSHFGSNITEDVIERASKATFSDDFWKSQSKALDSMDNKVVRDCVKRGKVYKTILTIEGKKLWKQTFVNSILSDKPDFSGWKNMSGTDPKIKGAVQKANEEVLKSGEVRCAVFGWDWWEWLLLAVAIGIVIIVILGSIGTAKYNWLYVEDPGDNPDEEENELRAEEQYDTAAMNIMNSVFV